MKGQRLSRHSMKIGVLVLTGLVVLTFSVSHHRLQLALDANRPISVQADWLVLEKDEAKHRWPMASTAILPRQTDEVVLAIDNTNTRWLEADFATSQRGVWGQDPAKLDGNSANEKCANRAYLVYRCHNFCGGLGDREKGIVTSFLLAVLTGRTFTIDIATPCGIENHLLSNEYDWLTCKPYALNVSKSETDYGPASLEKLSTAFANHSITRTLWTKKSVVFAINWYGIDIVRKYVQLWNVEKLALIVNATDDYVVHVILRTLLKPRNRLLDDLDAFHKQYVGAKQLVCSHIRIGKNPSIPTDVDFAHYRGQPNVTHILSFLQQYTNSNEYVIYVATDSEEVRQQSRAHLPNMVSFNRPIVHIDRFRKLDKQTACEGFFNNLAEQFLLSGCDILVLTHSNFGGIGALLSTSVKEVYAYSTPKDTVSRVDQWKLIQFYHFR